MKHLTLRNFIGLLVVVLVGYGCVHFKTQPVKNLSSKLYILILSADAIAGRVAKEKNQPKVDVIGAAREGISKAIGFISDAKDGAFEVNNAIGVLNTISVGNNKTLGEVLTPVEFLILEELISGMYVDLTPIGIYLPEDVNAEFAKKFEEVLRMTLVKLE